MWYVFLLIFNPRALYLKGDPYENTDAVFGVKNTLVVALDKVVDKEMAQKYGVDIGCALMTYDFVMVTEEAAMDLRKSNAEQAMRSQGRKMRFLDGLPIPELD